MKRALLVTALILCCATLANSQIEQGDHEFQMQGSIAAVENVTIYIVNASYGYFITPKLEIGGGPTISHVSVLFLDHSNVSLTLFGRYNFVSGGKTVPYLSGQVYQFDLSPGWPFSFTDFTYVQAGGGIKYFLNEYVAYDISANLGYSLGLGETCLLIFGGISAFF